MANNRALRRALRNYAQEQHKTRPGEVRSYGKAGYDEVEGKVVERFPTQPFICKS